MSKRGGGKTSGAVGRPSRMIGKNWQPSLDSSGVPQFGTLKPPPPTMSVPKPIGDGKPKRIATLAEHAAYLKLLGYPEWLIPGTPARLDKLQSFLDESRPIEPQDYRQRDRWQEEINRYGRL